MPDQISTSSMTADAGGADFAAALARAESGRERVIVTRDGRAVAALVPIEDVEALEDAEDERFAAEALARWETEGRPIGIPLAEVARELGIELTIEGKAAE